MPSNLSCVIVAFPGEETTQPLVLYHPTLDT